MRYPTIISVQTINEGKGIEKDLRELVKTAYDEFVWFREYSHRNHQRTIEVKNSLAAITTTGTGTKRKLLVRTEKGELVTVDMWINSRDKKEWCKSIYSNIF